MRSTLVVLFVIIVLSLPLGAAQNDNLWDIACSEPNPYIGDNVRFDIDSMYRGEYVVLVVEVTNTTGHRIFVDIIWIDGFGIANWTWKTNLDFEPGDYAVSFSYMGHQISEFTVTLVFDELDWLMKFTLQLELRLREQRDHSREAAIIATEANENVMEYIVRPGLVALFTSCINILLIFIVGSKYYADAVRERLWRSKHMSWLANAFTPQTDGNFNRMPGYEDVNEPDLGLTDEEFVRRSTDYTRVVKMRRN